MRHAAALALLLPAAAFGQARPNAFSTGVSNPPPFSSTDAPSYAVAGSTVLSTNRDQRPVLSLDGGRSARVGTLPHPVNRSALVGTTAFVAQSAYVTTDRKPILYRSSDGGAAWTFIGDGLLAAVGGEFTVASLGSDGASVYAMGTRSDRVAFFVRSADGGATWTNVPRPVRPNGSPIATLSRLDRSGTTLLLIGDGHVFRSTDDGATWTPVTPARLMQTSLSGTTPSSVVQYAWFDAAAGALYVGGQVVHSSAAAGPFEQLLYRTTDAGTTWTPLATPVHPLGAAPSSAYGGPSGDVVRVVRAQGVLAALVEPGIARRGLWLSYDDGATWRPSVRTHAGVRYASASQAFASDELLAVDGLVFTETALAHPDALDGTRPDPFAVLSATDSLRATLGGVAVRGPRRALATDTVFVRLNPQGNAPASGSNVVYGPPTTYTTPAYAAMSPHTWTVTFSDFAFNMFRACRDRCRYDFPFDPAKVPNPSALLLVRRVGPFWFPLPRNNFDFGTHRGVVGPGYVRAEGDQIAAGDYALASTDPANDLRLPATGVAVDEASAAAGLTLAAPSPNPARDGATVRFALASAGDVRLGVFDLLGREVAVLADGPHAPGAHAALVPTARMAPGVYVVRLAADGAVRTQRLVVAR